MYADVIGRGIPQEIFQLVGHNQAWGDYMSNVIDYDYLLAV